MSLSRHTLAPVLSCLLLVAICWGALSMWTDFPYFYHTDEPSKVRQVIDDERNFHHPLLMLDNVGHLVRWGWVPRENQAVAEAGRLFSALYMALACGLLAATLMRWHGLWVGLLGGLLLLVQPDVQEYARYFKEDPALLMGCAAVFAAMAWYERRPGWQRALLMGAAVGMACSGKYVGIAMLAPVLWVILAQKNERLKNKLTPLLPVICGLLITAALINLRIFTDWSSFTASLGRESTLVLEGQGDVKSNSIPHLGFFQRWLKRSWHVLPFCIVGATVAWRARRDRGWTAFLLVLFPLLWATLLAFSAKDSGRYFLPASLGIAAGAAIGIGHLCDMVKNSRLARPAMVGLPLLALGLSLARSAPYFEGFRNDARAQLFTFVETSLPPGSRIIEGKKVCLPDEDGKYADGWHHTLPDGVSVVSDRYIADLAASPAALSALGFTHAALAGDEYERYLRSDQKPKKSKKDSYQHRRAFYTTLFEQGELLWIRDPGKVGTHNPELRLYRLPPAPQDPTP